MFLFPPESTVQGPERERLADIIPPSKQKMVGRNNKLKLTQLGLKLSFHYKIDFQFLLTYPKDIILLDTSCATSHSRVEFFWYIWKSSKSNFKGKEPDPLVLLRVKDESVFQWSIYKCIVLGSG